MKGLFNMTIYKDEKRGTYYFVVRVKQNDGTIKQVKRRGFKTKPEAKRAEALALVNNEQTNSLTFQEAAINYFNWYCQRRKQSSINVIKNIIFNHLIKEFGSTKLDKITPVHVMKFQNKIINNYSPDFLKKIHTTLSAVFNFAIKFNGHSSNPAKITGNFELETNKRMNYWEFNEFKEFINVVDELLYKAFFFTLYYSGARKGELLALTWNDVDFNNCSIDINKTEYNRQITKPKTKASNRVILLPDFVIDLLLKLKTDAEKAAPVKNDYVVFGEIYNSISTTTLDRKYASYIQKSKVKKILLHEFRHSHASYLINKGVSPLVVAQRLGHSDVATTLNTYSHLYPSKQTEAVAFMKEDF